MTEVEPGFEQFNETILVEPLSPSDQFVGILAEPSIVYENVRAVGARIMNWLLPLIALGIVISAGMVLRTNDPQFMGNVYEQQEKQMTKQVESGKMTQEQADAAAEQMKSFEGFTKIMMIVGGAIGPAFGFFFMSLVFWIIAKFVLKGEITFALMLSTMGLSLYISIIDQLATLLVGYATGNMLATFSPAAFMTFDATSSLYKLLSQIDPIAIWGYVVFSIGLSVVAGIDRMKAYAVVFGLWLLFILGTSFISIPGMS